MTQRGTEASSTQTLSDHTLALVEGSGAQEISCCLGDSISILINMYNDYIQGSRLVLYISKFPLYSG